MTYILRGAHQAVGTRERLYLKTPVPQKYKKKVRKAQDWQNAGITGLKNCGLKMAVLLINPQNTFVFDLLMLSSLPEHNSVVDILHGAVLGPVAGGAFGVLPVVFNYQDLQNHWASELQRVPRHKDRTGT